MRHRPLTEAGLSAQSAHAIRTCPIGSRLSIRETPSAAIVGIGGIFPDAPDLGRFWDNIRNGRSAARQVPAGRWHLAPESLFDPEPGAADRVYSLRGCFIDKIPPLSLLSGLNCDPESLAGLDPLRSVVRDAIGIRRRHPEAPGSPE